MAAIRNILVAVKDPTATSLPALGKAARLAKAFGARLELFHAITETVLTETYFYEPEEYERIRRDARAQYRARLEALAEPLRKQGLTVGVHSDWDYPTHEAIVRHARKHKCGLIVAECHQGRRLAPWLLHLTDWELLRTSPIPVLLVRSGATWQDLNVLAAIDPTHRFAKPAKLDARILSTATDFASALKGTLHVVHSYVPVPAGAIPMAGASSAVIQQIAQGAEARAKEALQKAVAAYDIPQRRLHLVQGAPVDAIPAVTRKLQCGLVVMGAISRSGIKRVFIGNTAEQLLAALLCDVLVVKPEEFKSPVARRRRGVHFVGLPQSLGI
jgi:universal stress protein E